MFDRFGFRSCPVEIPAESGDGLALQVLTRCSFDLGTCDGDGLDVSLAKEHEILSV